MSLTYNDVATREDLKFHARCRSELGIKRYMELIPEARKAFEEGLKEPNEVKRLNVARRMANMVFTRELSKVNNEP